MRCCRRRLEPLQEYFLFWQLSSLKVIKVLSFDTGVKLFIHGKTKRKVAKNLQDPGVEILIDPLSFYVVGGPSVKKCELCFVKVI